MTPHRLHRRLVVCVSALLSILSVPAGAIDPATIKAQLTIDERTHVLKHALAWQPPAQTEELWIYLTDVELPLATAQDPAKVKELVGQGRLHGVKLIVDPVKPDPETLKGTLFLPIPAGYPEMPRFWESEGAAGWEKVSVGDKRVSGSLFVSADAGRFSSGSREFADTPGWSLEAEFSAPVFGPGDGGHASGGTQTLTGAKAQNSPQADAFLAYEKALLSDGIAAASAYMTPEKLADMRSMVEQFGADGFKEFQSKKRAETPQGDARRRQIEKVVVDGGSAVLEAQSGPNAVDVARLVKTKDGWKIGK